MKKLFRNIIILFVVLLQNGCIDDNITPPLTGELNPVAEMLVYFESQGDFANSPSAPGLVNAEEVYTNLNSYLVIDIRSSSEFTAGHIENAVNISTDSLYNYFKSIETTNFQKIIFVSSDGQSSAYFTCLLRLAGYQNVYSLNYGMASWNPDFADVWLNEIGDAPNITTYTNNDFPKNSLTDLPSVEFENPDAGINERINERIKKIISEGFSSAINIPPASENYLVCYGNMRLYYARQMFIFSGLGHPSGATHYLIAPDSDLRSFRYLQTLPTDQPIVIYDYNGQWSACMTAYLRVLGYNVKSLLFGANKLFYSRLSADPDLLEYAFSNSVIQNYPYLMGN